MKRPGFAWFVAWRHLRDPGHRSFGLLIFGLALLGLGILCVVVEYVVRTKLPLPSLRSMFLFKHLKLIGAVIQGLGFLVSIWGALVSAFTFFAATSMFGVFLGTWFPIMTLSVMSGFEMDLKSKIRATKADVMIGRADDVPFEDWEAVQARIAGQRGVVASMAYIETEVIIKHVSNPAGMGIILRGIDPPRAGQVLDLGRTLREGKVEYLTSPDQIPTIGALLGDMPVPPGADPDRPPARAPVPLPVPPPERKLPGILLGEELFSHTLRVYLGSEVDVACPLCGTGPAGPMPKMKSFRVAGHFYSGLYEFDSKLAYVALADAQKFLGMKGEVTGIEVRIKDPDDAPGMAERIGRLLGPKYEVRSWQELNRGLFRALRLEKVAMFVALTFIALLASFSIISNLVVMATKKGREIAIMKSMGAADAGIMQIFVAEGVYIGLLGLAIGVPTGILICLLISRSGLPLDPDVYYIQTLPVVMKATEIVLVAVAALALCCVATIYPAYLASRIRPVEGLRQE
jgi:lipoprotein-releasing system permease protein